MFRKIFSMIAFALMLSVIVFAVPKQQGPTNKVVTIDSINKASPATAVIPCHNLFAELMESINAVPIDRSIAEWTQSVDRFYTTAGKVRLGWEASSLTSKPDPIRSFGTNNRWRPPNKGIPDLGANVVPPERTAPSGSFN